MPSRVRPEWNDSVTGEAAKYALSKQDVLKRKRNLVSKHNVLQQREGLLKRTVRGQKRLQGPSKSNKMASTTRTYAVINNKIHFDAEEDAGSVDDDEDCDTTVLQLLRSPNRAEGMPPFHYSTETTPGMEDITHDMMKRFVSSPSQAAAQHCEDSGSSDDDAREYEASALKDSSSLAFEVSVEKEKSVMIRSGSSVRGIGRSPSSSTAPTARAPAVRGTPKIMQPVSAKHTKLACARTQTRTADASGSVLSETSRSNSCVPETAQSDAAAASAELKEMNEEIATLFRELQYYEQLSGRRSALEVDSELTELADVFGGNGGKSGSRQNLMKVIRTLTRLVCQTMTYLLKSEVDLQEHRTREATLTERMDALTTLVMPHSSGIFTSEEHDLQSERVPSAPAAPSSVTHSSAFDNIMSRVPTISTRVSEHALNGQVAAMREALRPEQNHEAYLSKYYDAKRYGSIVNAAEDGCGSLNISLSEGFAQVEKVPFNVNLSPVRDGANSLRPPRPPESSSSNAIPSMQAKLTGSSTSDLLFGGSAMSASLSEQVGPALHRASASAAKVEEALGTPTRGRPDLARLNKVEVDHTARSYVGYQSTQRKLELNDSSDSDSEEEPQPSPMPYARREKSPDPFLQNPEDDDKYWEARLSAVNALNSGLSHLSVAVSTVKIASPNYQSGPYSSRARANSVDHNEASSLRNSSDGMGVQAPTPTETPRHPFTDVSNTATTRYARVGVNVVTNTVDQKVLPARGRGTERTFEF